MIVLIGKTCSGKDTILNQLVKLYGYKKMITYTTRPMRKGEENGKTYHFITVEEFKRKRKADDFLEYKEYNTVEGVWYYGSAKEDYLNTDDKTVVILTPSGLLDLEKYIEGKNMNLVKIFIEAKEDVIRKRLEKRGDDKEEANRRVLSDNIDFEKAESLVDRVFCNNDASKLNDLLDRLDQYVLYRNYDYSKNKK